MVLCSRGTYILQLQSVHVLGVEGARAVSLTRQTAGRQQAHPRRACCLQLIQENQCPGLSTRPALAAPAQAAPAAPALTPAPLTRQTRLKGQGTHTPAAPGASPLCSPRKTSLNFRSGFPNSPDMDMALLSCVMR